MVSEGKGKGGRGEGVSTCLLGRGGGGARVGEVIMLAGGRRWGRKGRSEGK